MDNRPIGIFDSGIGGLTVLKEVKKQLPGESVIYYGDLARVPFGSKSKEEIIQINKDIISYLVSRDVKMILIACNTSSSFALEADRKEFDVPILGLIEPGAKAAVEVTKNGKIGIFATEGTVSSRSYVNGIKNIDPLLNIYQSACPKFVPLIEAGKFSGSEVDEAIKEYITPLAEEGVDTLVHGCTHYPYLEEAISAYFDENFVFVNPAEGIVTNAKEVLEKHNLLSEDSAEYDYIVTKMEGEKYVRVDGREQLLGSASVIKV